MEIRNLMSFIQVAELNSFTKAAEVLGYSQSTVSFQIKQLETELDCLLFERINHTITLTERGKELLSYAHDVCRLTDEFKQNIEETKELTGVIHLVAPDSVCEDMLMTNYNDFHSKYPGISLKFTAADTGDMFDMLDRNEADLMVTLDNHVYKSDYVIAKEQHIPMHFVTSKKSPLAKKKKISINDLLDYQFILTEKGMGYRRILDKALEKKSIEILPVLEVGRTDIITELLAYSDDKISYLPDFVTKEKIENGDLVFLNVTDIETDIWKQLIYHKNKWVSNSLKALIEYIKQAEFNN
ncbi:MAG: LysR family transcriptional regulator [Ruminococcaceae bacterium]|nr:LysR family transcriptional regulator [Oscillospiraceae bacterium]